MRGSTGPSMALEDIGMGLGLNRGKEGCMT